MSGQLHAVVTLPLEKKSTDSHWIRSYMDPTAGMDETNFFSLLGIEPWTVQSTDQSLYRLHSINNEVSSKIRRLNSVLELLTFCCWLYWMWNIGCIVLQSGIKLSSGSTRLIFCMQVCTDILRTECYLNDRHSSRPSTYRAVNTLRLSYKNQSVNDV